MTCKRCGSQLVVDGTSSPASVSSEGPTRPPSEAPTRSPGEAPTRPPAEDGDYLVAFDDEHKKALGVRAIITLYARGAIDAETLVWREGMSGWKPLFDVEALALALGRAGHGPPAPAASTGEPITQVAPAEEDVTRIFKPAEEKPAPDEDATRIFSNEKAISSRPKPGGWNEPAKWRHEGPRDAIGKVEWREQGAVAAAAPRVAPRLPGSWSERGVEDDEVTHMVAPLEDPTARRSDSERPLTGQRSESSVLFSLRAMAQSDEEAARRKQSEAADERVLVARPAAAPLTADVSVFAPPSSAPPPAQRFNSQSELPAATETAPPARPPSSSLRRPFTAVLGVSLIALGALYATDRWSLVTGFAHTVWQRLGLHR